MSCGPSFRGYVPHERSSAAIGPDVQRPDRLVKLRRPRFPQPEPAMRVSILGAGAIAFGAAAYLAKAGHDPLLWSPSGRATAELAGGEPLKARNAVAGSFLVRVAHSAEEAVEGADLVMVALPGYGHRAVMDRSEEHTS